MITSLLFAFYINLVKIQHDFAVGEGLFYVDDALVRRATEFEHHALFIFLKSAVNKHVDIAEHFGADGGKASAFFLCFSCYFLKQKA